MLWSSTERSADASESAALLDLVDPEVARRDVRTASLAGDRPRGIRPSACVALALVGIIAAVAAVLGTFPAVLQVSSSKTDSKPFISLAGKDGPSGQAGKDADEFQKKDEHGKDAPAGPPGQSDHGGKEQPNAPGGEPGKKGEHGGEQPNAPGGEPGKKGEHGGEQPNAPGGEPGKKGEHGGEQPNAPGGEPGKKGEYGGEQPNAPGGEPGKKGEHGGDKPQSLAADHGNKGEDHGHGNGKHDHPEGGDEGGGSMGGLLGTIAAEVTGLPDCVQHEGKGQVTSVVGCAGGIIEDHTQTGLTISREDFHVPKPTTASWIVTIASVCVYLGIIVAFVLVPMLSERKRIRFVPLCFSAMDIACQDDWLRGEALISILQTWTVVLVAIPIGLLVGGGKVPALLGALLIALPAGRGLLLDYGRALNAKEPPTTFGDWMVLFTSKLDIVDATSDGIALATIFLLETTDAQAGWHARMSAAWGTFPASLFLPIMGQPHGLSMAMGLALISPCAVLLFSSQVARYDFGDTMLGPLLGFGLTGKRKAAGLKKSEEGLATQFSGAMKLCFEGVPQIFLQGTAVMVAGEGLVSQPALAFSMAMSWATGTVAATKLFITFSKLFFFPEKGVNINARDKITGYLGLGVLVLTIIALTLSVLRLFSAELCESKLWNISSGCVAAPSMHEYMVP